MEWTGYAIALFVALIAWLAGLNAASRGAERGATLAFENTLRLEEARRAAHVQDLRAALIAELQLNHGTVELAATTDLVGMIRTQAWDAVIGISFTEREWKALVDAERRLAAYAVAATVAPSEALTSGSFGMWTMAAKTRAKEALTYLESAIAVLEGRG